MIWKIKIIERKRQLSKYHSYYTLYFEKAKRFFLGTFSPVSHIETTKKYVYFLVTSAQNLLSQKNSKFLLTFSSFFIQYGGCLFIRRMATR